MASSGRRCSPDGYLEDAYNILKVANAADYAVNPGDHQHIALAKEL
jgi:hypothetical protein